MEHSTSFFTALSQLPQVPLDIRTMTLGISIADCGDHSLHTLCDSIYRRINEAAGNFAKVCQDSANRFGVPILQRRLSVTPIDRVAQGHNADDLVHVARTLDGATAAVHADRIGGFAADVQHGMSSSARQIISCLPIALSETVRVRAAVHVGSSQSGVNLDAIRFVAAKLRDIAEATAALNGRGAAKLAVLANDSTGHPHLTGACLGDGWGDRVLHVGIGAAAIIRHALLRKGPELTTMPLDEILREVQTAAFQATRAAEIVGREVAQQLNAEFGSIDVTLGPTVRPGDSVIGLLPLLGIERLGAPGSATALAMLYLAVRNGGAFASTSVGSYSRVMLSVLEDPFLAELSTTGDLTLDQLRLMATASAGGLDLIPISGDTDVETIAALLADHVSMAVLNERPAAIRLVPVPGKKAGDRVEYENSQLGQAAVFGVPGAGLSKTFIARGGRLPAVR
ncbi:MAG: DUF711 family protein [Planctomycetaceae bacterium]